MKNGKRCTAILLAAGNGRRMHSDVAKQYMDLCGKPVLWYSLNAIEGSRVIDDCILAAGADDLDYVREKIVQKYSFSKVAAIVSGGEERYASVQNALKALAGGKLNVENRDGYVFIHDGARPFLTEDMLERLAADAEEFLACTAAVPAKDTVKITDDDGFAMQTPDRRRVFNVQTPQVFDTQLILAAYERLEAEMSTLKAKGIAVTDDAGVVEMFTDRRVKMTEGSYQNIKITTPEDMLIARAFLERCEG